MSEGKLLICLMGSDGSASENRRQEDNPLPIGYLDYLDLRVAFRDGPRIDFGALPREQLVRKLLEHQEMLEKLGAGGMTVLPVKFGTWLSDARSVEGMVRQLYRPLRNLLESVTRKVEFDVVAQYADFQQVLEDAASSPEIQRMKARAGGASPDEFRALQIALGKSLKDALDDKRDALRAMVMEEVGALIEERRGNPLMDERMVLNDAFLLEDGRQDAFCEGISSVDRRLGGLLNIRVLGPMPPGSFFTVALEAVDPQRLEEARRQLRLDEVTSLAQIRESYRRLSQSCHPDQGGSSEQIEKLNGAYEFLKNYSENVPVLLDGEHLRQCGLYAVSNHSTGR